MFRRMTPGTKDTQNQTPQNRFRFSSKSRKNMKRKRRSLPANRAQKLRSVDDSPNPSAEKGFAPDDRPKKLLLLPLKRKANK